MRVESNSSKNQHNNLSFLKLNVVKQEFQAISIVLNIILNFLKLLFFKNCFFSHSSVADRVTRVRIVTRAVSAKCN